MHPHISLHWPVVWVREPGRWLNRLSLMRMQAGGIAGIVGNPAEIIMVRMQGDFAKPPEKRLNYKNCFDGLFRVRRGHWHACLSVP